MSNCNIKNPLIRDGTSRSQRLLKALSPSYVKPDEHSLSDLINIAKEFALKILYYNYNNQAEGNWQAFIENDISTIIASITNTDTDLINNCFYTNYNFIRSSSSQNDNVRSAFDNTFRSIVFIAGEINKWYVNSVPGLKLNSELKQTVNAQLRDYFNEIIVYYKSALNSGKNLIKTDINKNFKSVLFEGDIQQIKFDTIWIFPVSAETNWHEYLNNIKVDDSLFKNNPAAAIDLVKNAADKLNQFFGKFYNAAVRLVNNAPDYLEETLENYPTHQPHMALFLTFLRLFQTAQNDLNKITGRHLDFYFKDVLQITNKGEVADEVYLIFELAKQINSYLLKEGTELKAGKDSSGKEVTYKTIEDVVLNKASVSKIKTVYIDNNDQGRVYDATAANSKNGLGKAFDSNEPKWKTFGESQKDIVPDKRTMEFSSIGFALSSSALLLNEGNRTVTVILYTSGPFDAAIITANKFKIYLSAKNKWIETTPSSVSANGTSGIIVIIFELTGDADPVTDFYSSGLEGDFYPHFPVLKVMLANNPAITPPKSNYAYAALRKLKLIKAEVKTEVTGISNLILQNDTGLLKAGKPFYPFGSNPGIDSNFYIGSRELFQKDLTALKIHIQWKDLPDEDLKDYYDNLITLSSAGDFKVQAYTLNDYAWTQLGSDSGDGKKRSLFNSKDPDDTSGKYKEVDLTFDAADLDGYESGLIEDSLTVYDVSTKRGFIKLSISDPSGAFGHMIYPGIYTKAIIDYAVSKGVTDNVPNQPYTPFIESLVIDYTAVQTIELPPSGKYGTNKNIFYQIYPFGIKEIKSSSIQTDLLPQFTTEIESVKTPNEGELYIGVKDLNPSETLSLLFQMAEGSADPELPKQEIIWSYISGDEWLQFDESEIISDGTNGLLKSGIINFSIPEAADDDNTMLPAGYYWLKASVTGNSKAVCSAIDIIAQAVTAVYEDNSNSPDFLEGVLPSGKISKMKVKDSAIKSVSQPFASLGGKPKETDDEFYIRVSERLRHKNRGITIWDYERIVLQQFPSIYKVKCINHSTYNPDADEFAPGFVSLIIIPSLFNKNAVNPLEPRAPAAMLTEIKDFIGKIISPFAKEKIKVLNPLYEKIQVEFKVKFKKGYDDWGYYSVLLQNDIIDFLSPWAFEDGKDISFGGKIHKSMILNFIEERYYADFVTDFKMVMITKDQNGQDVSVYVEEAVPSTARSILVSNDTHKIEKVVNC